MNNYPCTIRSTLIDQNPDEVYHTLFMVSLDRCNVSCNAVENSFCKICVLNNIEDVDLKVLNMIIGINESKTLIKHILCEYWRIFWLKMTFKTEIE